MKKASSQLQLPFDLVLDGQHRALATRRLMEKGRELHNKKGVTARNGNAFRQGPKPHQPTFYKEQS